MTFQAIDESRVGRHRVPDSWQQNAAARDRPEAPDGSDSEFQLKPVVGQTRRRRELACVGP